MRNRLSERPKAPIGIDVINHDYALRSQGWPGSIQFEPNVTFAMQAIVNEKVDLT